MSKKRGKAVAKPAPKKKKTVRAAATRRSAAATQTGSATGGGTSQVTITLFRTGAGNRIRTSPQRAFVDLDGHVEWTVVNMIDGTDVPVRITWPDRNPFGTESLEFKGWRRESVLGAKAGTYKYVVHAYDTHEDPELEIPDL
jgi:hypothetical protein